ncbi:hypothetical protein VZO05_03685 [Aggregatilineales bacterium SYSU G02658]
MGAPVKWRWLAALMLILAACAPQRQPVGSVIATPTATAAATAVVPLRYGLGASLRPLHLNDQPLRQIALVDELTTDNADGYDIVISLLPQDDFIQSTQPLALGFVLSQTPPLEDSALYDRLQALLAHLDLPGLTNHNRETVERVRQQARTTWLTHGLPDGLQLVLAYEVDLLIPEITAQLAQANVELVTLPISSSQRPAVAQRSQAHLYWTLLADPQVISRWQALLPSAEVIVVGDVWLYYKLAEGVAVTGYSSEGLPLIERQ